MNVPAHIGFIMDGNGRWAKLRGKPRLEGHRRGLKAVERVMDLSMRFGVKYLSLYVFSTENWKRPKEEVDGLFALAEGYLSKFQKLCKDRIRVVFSGDVAGLPPKLVKKLDDVVKKTSSNGALCVNLCINYGGRKEIVDAVKKLTEKGADVTEQSLHDALYNDLPDPDLIVRTGGQLRLSNFLLYQSAYSELYFTDTLWPDFGQEEFEKILAEYALRTRNFGGLTDAQ